MSSKAEVIAKIINTSTYIGTAVKTFINEVHCEERLQPPSIFKKGDVIRVRVNNTSDKARPSVIIRVFAEYVISIPLSTCEDLNNLCESTGSRFLKEGWFCNIYLVSPISYANENFLGIYDNNKSLNNAIKELKLFINKNI